MWHYKLPTRQHARRTYTRCLLEECCRDNVYNYYYYCYYHHRRRRWARVSGANFIRFVHAGTKFGAQTDYFFPPHRCSVYMYTYIGTYNYVIRNASRGLISKKVILVVGPGEE